MEKMEWYASYMEPTGWDITAMTAGFFNYAMPQCWFSAMMAQMPEDVSIPLLDNSDEFISALSEFKTCNDDTRLRELFELLINTDLDQVLDVPLTHQMDMIVYNTDKIADYNFASDYAFLDVTQITPGRITQLGDAGVVGRSRLPRIAFMEVRDDETNTIASQAVMGAGWRTS